MPSRRVARGLGFALALAALGSGIGWAAHRGVALPAGPVAIAWDREACAHCRMHVGDPRYAAQLQTTDGEVRNYDDPGCLLRDMAERQLTAHAIWFRDSIGDRWIASDHVGFARATNTPMDWGVAAVPMGTPGAISLDEASVLVRARK